MNTWESLSIPMEAQWFALQVAISGAVVSGLVLLAARVLRRRSAPLRYGVLLAGVFGLLAVPALVGVGLNVPLPAAGEEIVKVSADMLPAFLDRPAVEEPPMVAETSSVGDTVGTVLLIVWGGFALLGLMRLLFGLWKQHRRIIGQPWGPAWWTDERRACLAQKVGLRRFPAAYSSPAAPMPMVVGLLRPKIVLPEVAPSTWGQPQWEAVLLHEAAHIARRDPWAAFAQCLAVILFWWCPLVHLMARRLNDLREAICDDYALEGPCDRLAYAELLVESAERLIHLRTMPAPVGLIDSARGGLEERITRLLAKEKEPMKKLSLAGKLLGASLLVAACLSITAATAFTQPPAAKKIQIKIIIDGKEIDLNEANLAALLQAVQPKPAPQLEFKPDGRQAEAAAFSRDGTIVAVSDGKTIMVFDVKTGKMLSKTVSKADPIAAAGTLADIVNDPQRIQFKIREAQPGAKPNADPKAKEKEQVFKFFMGGLQLDNVKPNATPQAGPDPRIEELVRQAEAIKPGSGADIRRALQAKPKPVGYYAPTVNYQPYSLPVSPSPIEHGKQVIVLTIDASGKVVQLHGAELKKFLEKGAASGGPDARFTKPVDPTATEQDKKAAEEALRHAELYQKAIQEATRVQALKALGAMKAGPAPPATPMVGPVPPKLPTPPMGVLPPKAIVPPPDVEALARQLERITAELHELRKRLDANKK